MQKTLGELAEYVKERKVAVLIPCFLETTYRMLVSIKDVVTPQEYASLKGMTGGFFAEIVKL